MLITNQVVKHGSRLCCGGAAGHLQHLYDNRELTFGELKEILSAASEGRLERCTEKLDGQALQFSWDSSTDTLRAARNSGDLQSGGMGVQEIAAKFRGRGNVEEAFTSGFRILHKALTALSTKQKIAIFGRHTNTWYPVEIIYTRNANVIVYDSNNIVLHMSPVISVDDEGNISRDTTGESAGFQLLTSSIEKMQAALDERDWKINGPRFLQLGKLSSGEVLSDVLGAIDDAMDSAGVGDGDTIEDYLHTIVLDEVSEKLGISSDACLALTDYILGRPNPGLNAIKKMVPREKVTLVQTIAKGADSILKEAIRPIELAVNHLAVEVLKGLHSTLIGDSDREVQRLQGEVQQAIQAIRSSNNETAMAVLQSQLEKLGDVENITTPMEGVVFIVNGNAYKLTGSFSAINQILGLFKYGRSGIPAMKKESRHRDPDEARLWLAVERIGRHR